MQVTTLTAIVVVCRKQAIELKNKDNDGDDNDYGDDDNAD